MDWKFPGPIIQYTKEKMDLAVKDNPLGKEKIGKLIYKFAVPSIIAMLVSSLYNIVDQLFVGNKIGELGNAATNITFPLNVASIALLLMFGTGGAAAYNLSLGRGERETAPYYMGNAASMLIISGLFLTLITEVFLGPLLRFFGSPDTVFPYAYTYARIIGFGFPFICIATGGGNLLRADGRPNKTLACNLSGAVINTILDAWFIYGLEWGMAGAAWATLIGQVFSGLLSIYYLTRCKTIKLELKHIIPKPKYVLKAASLGIASFANQMAIMVVQISLNKSLKYYGGLSIYGESIPIAAAGIATKVNQVFFSIIIGLSQSMQPISSFNYGARKFGRVKEVYFKVLLCGLVTSLVAMFCFQVFPESIIKMFGAGTPEYINFGIKYFRSYFAAVCISFIQNESSVLFNSIGKPKRGMFLALTRQVIFLLPLLYILPLFFGIDGITFSAPIADTLSVITSLLMVRWLFNTEEFKNYKGIFKYIFTKKISNQ